MHVLREQEKIYGSRTLIRLNEKYFSCFYNTLLGSSLVVQGLRILLARQKT